MTNDAAPCLSSFTRLRRRTGSIATGFKAFLFLSLACLLSASLVSASAAPLALNDDGTPDAAAPKQSNTRAVRLSNVEGDVRVMQDGEVIADPALANQPLFEGSEITTSNEGRAEIQLDNGNIARLSPNTTLVLSVLKQGGTGTRTEMVLRSGLAYFELQPSTAEHSLRVNYGTAAFSASSFSVVRLTNDEPPGELAVFTGAVHLERGDMLQLDIHGGESLSLDASDLGKYNVASTIESDSWDSWNSDRDQFLNSEAADKTAATGNLKNYSGDGMSDLDANGSWYNVPGQGYVWSPYDAQSAGASWDPYGYGNWVSYPQFGYIWVSGYPWGYTPFQCGMWDYFDSFGWGWSPGAGCYPWWGFGAGYYGGGWGFRLGNNFPSGYHPPHRPVGPGHPIPRPHPGGPNPRPRPEQPHRTQTAPVIAVDRRPSGSGAAPVVGRRPSSPAVIAGWTVEPLRPVAPRQAYTHPEGGFVNRAAPLPPSAYSGGAHPTYPIAPARPAQGQFGSPRPYTPPPMRPPPSAPSGGHMSAPPPMPHSAPAPAPHK